MISNFRQASTNQEINVCQHTHMIVWIQPHLMLYRQTSISRINGGFRGVGLQGAEYDVGLRFTRGGIMVCSRCLGHHPSKLQLGKSPSFLAVFL